MTSNLALVVLSVMIHTNVTRGPDIHWRTPKWFHVETTWQTNLVQQTTVGTIQCDVLGQYGVCHTNIAAILERPLPTKGE